MAVESEGKDEHFDATLSDLDEGVESKDFLKMIHKPGNNEGTNEGWADAMARILEKQLPKNKPPVLVKYKKVEKRRAEKKEERDSKKLKSQERHAMLEKDRVKPDGSSLDFEKNLASIATRGVVKLFNAVSKHQKEMESKLNSAPTEAKKSKVVASMSKSAFLDMLKSSSDKHRTQENNNEQQVKTSDRSGKSDTSSTWNILRDDFMMGAKMKDWNREEQQTKRKDKKLTNITDHDLEMNDADFSDESDDGDNEDSE